MQYSNLPLADRYAIAKAHYDAAEKALKEIKKEIEESGKSLITGVDYDLTVHLSQRSTVSEDMLMNNFGITLNQLNSCKVEGKPFAVVKVKAKTAIAA